MYLKPKNFDVQGHRGCRGLFPENTLSGFKHALNLGVTTLELDVVISKDKKVVVSHDPYLSSIICLNPDGEKIQKKDEKNYTIFKMNYSEIRKFNCGCLKNPDFPKQKKTDAYKPLLSEVFELAESYTNKIKYNIETKCHPLTDNVLHPNPKEFSELLLNTIYSYNVKKRVTIQSFDIRTLQYFKSYQDLNLSLLINNNLSVEKNLTKLGFTPQFYSPNYQLVNSELKSFCNKNKMKLLPWTVNKPSDMKNLIKIGVDGIITDYPNLLLKIIN